MPRPFSQTKRNFPKRVTPEQPHAPGPFSATPVLVNLREEHWMLFDANGQQFANCGKGAKAAVNAAWVARVLSKACHTEEHAKRVAKAFASPEKP